MEIDHTCISPLEIVEFLWIHFQIRVFSCRKLADTSSNVYCLETNNKRLVLKEYPADTPMETISLEIDMCSYLTQKGFTVPTHIQDLSGRSIIPFKGHYFTVYPWIPGNRLPFHTGSLKQSLQCAQMYGKLVYALRAFPTPLRRKDAFDRSAAAIEKSIREHETILNAVKDDSIKEELTIKLGLLRELKNEHWEGFDNITWLNSHGDYCSNQILFEQEEVCGLLDFTSAKQMPVIFELFRSFLYIGRGFQNGLPDMRDFSEYLRYYEKYEILNAYDIRYAVRCYYLRILKSIFGYQQYSKNPTDFRYLHIGRDLFRQCILIHNNEAQLTAQLCKEMYG